jgi:hypothetical protein
MGERKTSQILGGPNTAERLIEHESTKCPRVTQLGNLARTYVPGVGKRTWRGVRQRAHPPLSGADRRRDGRGWKDHDAHRPAGHRVDVRGDQRPEGEGSAARRARAADRHVDDESRDQRHATQRQGKALEHACVVSMSSLTGLSPRIFAARFTVASRTAHDRGERPHAPCDAASTKERPR